MQLLEKAAKKRAYARQWAKENPDKRRASQRAYKARHRERINAKHAEYMRLVGYPRILSRKELQLGRTRPDVCEICGRDGRIDWDHCHRTGKARGWLCQKCNAALAMVSDDCNILRGLIAYLEKAE